MSRIVAILGPTAGGKTDLAIEVALAIGGQVISVDSMQVYRGMDIGTAKPSMAERRGVVHHLVDIVDPEVDFTVAEFRALGREVIHGVGSPLIISGGSGLHFRALVDPMTFAPADPEVRTGLEQAEHSELVERLLDADPQAGEQVDLSNPRRVVRALEIYELTGETPTQRAASDEAERLRAYQSEIGFVAFGVDPGDHLDDRIDRRLDVMLEAGLVDEVARLWPRMGRTARAAVGYREIAAHLEGQTTLDEALTEIQRSTRRLARKQRMWFERDPRIHWIPWDPDPGRMSARVLEAL